MSGLLEALKIEDIVDRGDEIGARCPLHEKRTGERENHPRHWSINKSTGLHSCFSCHYKGGIVTLVRDVSGLDLWDAMRLIRSFGVDTIALTSDPKEREVEPPKPLPVPLEFFSEPPDRALRRRGLSRETCAHYGIRWDPEESGWVLPIYSSTGDLMGYQIKMPDRVRNVPLRIPKSKTLFGLKQFQGSRVIVVESPLDVAYVHTLGWEGEAVALFGSYISREQETLTKGISTSVVLALDNDSSGIRETRRILSSGFGRKIPTYVLNYKKTRAKDPGEMTSTELLYALNHAVPSVFWTG